MAGVLQAGLLTTVAAPVQHSQAPVRKVREGELVNPCLGRVVDQALAAEEGAAWSKSKAHNNSKSQALASGR